MSNLSTSAISPDFRAFLTKLSRGRVVEPERLTRIGMRLVDGALRVRRGGDGIYGAVDKPATKQAEAIAEWLRSLEESTTVGAAGYSENALSRGHEAREAVVAAARELDLATRQMPAASRLRSALYNDALTALGADEPGLPPNFWPWAAVVGLAGVVIGLIIRRR